MRAVGNLAPSGVLSLGKRPCGPSEMSLNGDSVGARPTTARYQRERVYSLFFSSLPAPVPLYLLRAELNLYVREMPNFCV